MLSVFGQDLCKPLTIRFLFAYTAAMSEERDRGAVLIAACLVAAIRLRGEPIQPSPKLKATILRFGSIGDACLARDPGAWPKAS